MNQKISWRKSVYIKKRIISAHHYAPVQNIYIFLQNPALFLLKNWPLKRYLFYFISYCRKGKGKAKTFSKISLQHKTSFVHNIYNFSFHYLYCLSIYKENKDSFINMSTFRFKKYFSILI